MSILSKISSFTKGNSVNGIEVVIQPDGTYLFNLVVVKKEKSELSTEKQESNIASIEVLKSLIKLTSPTVLVINGKGIICKKVFCKADDSVKVILNKVLPNANENEFSIQLNTINEATAFVSVIRNNVLNEILDLFLQNGLVGIIDCFVGPFVLNNVFSMITVDNYFHFDNYILELRDTQIIDLSNTDDSAENTFYKVGDDEMSAHQLIAFATALSYFIPTTNFGLINSLNLEDVKSNSSEKRKFEVRGKGILVSLFLLLIANFFAFSYYWESNNELSAKLEINNSSLKTVDTLKKEIAQKKQFLEQNGILENSMTSYYADRLAKQLPNEINWTNLDIHPLKKKDPNDQSEILSFENKAISIIGNCRHSSDLNDWMKDIKKYDWIKAVELLNYTQSNASEDGVFVLKIELK